MDNDNRNLSSRCRDVSKPTRPVPAECPHEVIACFRENWLSTGVDTRVFFVLLQLHCTL